MNRQNQSPCDSIAAINWGSAFRAQAIRTIPDIPIVTSTGFVVGVGKIRAVRTPHWLSRFVTCPAASTAADRLGATDNRWVKHIAEWSNHLPADCVHVEVSPGRPPRWGRLDSAICGPPHIRCRGQSEGTGN
jgi:hypothetical protein